MLKLACLVLLIWLVRKAYKDHQRRARDAQRKAKGDAGEAAVSRRLAELLDLMREGTYCIRDSLILNHAPGTAFPTAEIDHLVITSFGIFVVETKNWSGRILPAERNTLRRVANDGTSEHRKNPASQNVSKVAFLRLLLPQHAKTITGIGVFSDPGVRLDMQLRSDLLHINELGYWLRASRDAFNAKRVSPIAVEDVVQKILSQADISPDAAEMHKKRVTRESRRD